MKGSREREREISGKNVGRRERPIAAELYLHVGWALTTVTANVFLNKLNLALKSQN